MLLETAVDKFADAIAYAEGFYSPNSRSARNHNPGDLTLDITGTGIGHDGPFIVYENDADGWAALKHQVAMALTDASGIYNSSMSILEFATHYVGTIPEEAEAWAINVARRLGVTVDTILANWMQSGGTGLVSGGLVLLVLFGVWLVRRGGA